MQKIIDELSNKLQQSTMYIKNMSLSSTPEEDYMQN